MAMEVALGNITKLEDTNANKILESLLNPKNIDMKTHIVSPVTFAILHNANNWFEKLFGPNMLSAGLVYEKFYLDSVPVG